MGNYYQILEVDINASDEMIERAYKLLAKRYHPDTKPEEKKQWAEEEFKKINEAYEILSNKEKRESYTKELEFEKDNKLNSLYLAKESLEEQVHELQMELQLWKTNHSTNNYSPNLNTETYNYHRQYSNPQQQVYTQPEPQYYNYYSNPTKDKLKSISAIVLTIVVFLVIGFIIWKIPFTKKILLDFYENNTIIKSIVDIFLNLFKH